MKYPWVLGLAAAGLFGSASVSSAAWVGTLTEVNSPVSGVSLSGSGSLTYTSWEDLGGVQAEEFVYVEAVPDGLSVYATDAVTDLHYYMLDVGLTFSDNFGALGWNSGIYGVRVGGPSVGFTLDVSNTLGHIFVPDGYVPGSALPSTSAFFEGESLASLGLVPGTYTMSWGSGATADFVSIIVSDGTSPIPEPSAVLSCGLLVGAGLLLRSRRTRRA